MPIIDVKANPYRNFTTNHKTGASWYTDGNYSTYRYRYRSATVHGDGFTPTSYKHKSYAYLQKPFSAKSYTYQWKNGVYGPHLDRSVEGNIAMLPIYKPWSVTGVNQEPVYQWDRDGDGIVDTLVVEALNALKNEKVQLGTTLAESIRELDNWASLYKRLGHTLWAMNRGFPTRWVRRTFKRMFGKPGRASGTAAQLWLEYNLAIAPTLGTLYDGMKALQEGLGSDNLYVRGKAKYTLNRKEEVDDSGHNPPTQIKTSTWSSREDYAVSFIGILNDEFIAKAKALDVDNPYSTAWELVPFSFVMDWFVNIGDFLESLNATSGMTYGGGYRSLKVTGSGSYTDEINTDWSPGVPRIRNSGGSDYVYEMYERYTYGIWPAPTIVVRRKEDFFSTKRVITALALMIKLKGSR